MPVLESTDNQITPKSILRYRPIGESTSRSRSLAPSMASGPKVARASRLRPPDVSDGSEEREEVAEWQRGDQRSHGSAQIAPSGKIKRTTSIPALPHAPHKTSTTGPHKTWPKIPSLRLSIPRLSPPTSVRRIHPLLYLGLGMCTMLVLWFLLSMIFGW